MVLEKPPKVFLPNPGLIADLFIESQRLMYVAESGMDNYFHSLARPERISTYFGLPPINMSGEGIWSMKELSQWNDFTQSMKVTNSITISF